MIWGTDSVWWGSPQWQIETRRRLEILTDMQMKCGCAPLGPADSFDAIRCEYLAPGGLRSNFRYGYLA